MSVAVNLSARILHDRGLPEQISRLLERWSLPPDAVEIEKAAELFRQAATLDPGEKYFAEPIQRLETSRDYALTAQKMAADAREYALRGKGDRRGRRAERRADVDTGAWLGSTDPDRPTKSRSGTGTESRARAQGSIAGAGGFVGAGPPPHDTAAAT